MDKRSEMDPLLISYLSGETSPQENDEIQQWLASDEQNRHYFETLSQAWRTSMENAADVPGEWQHFQDLLAARNRRKGFVRKMAFTAAAAASIVAAVLWMTGRSGLHKTQEPNVAAAPSKVAPKEALWQQIINHSDTAQRYTLPDGSEVLLSGRSEVAYRLAADSRSVSIKGEASFSVAKDRNRAFSVYSEDIMTTALGTNFSVADYPGENNITIRLHEGKVVVRSVDSAGKRLSKDFYLQPGHQLVYDKQKATARLSSFRGAPLAGAKVKQEPAVTDSLQLSSGDMGSWYMFNNQSLDAIFGQLQEMFRTRIVYEKKDVRNKYFIGRFDKSDSLINILKKITLINDLRLTQKDNMFIITK